jgi:putative DNA primase/helicase
MRILRNDKLEEALDQPDKEVCLSPAKIALMISDRGEFITGNDEQLRYYNEDSNTWDTVPTDHEVNKEIFHLLGSKFSRSKEHDTHRALTINTNVGKLNKGALDQKITLKNGIFDIKKMAISEHDRELHNCYSLNVNYNKDATCPNWLKFLDSIFANDCDKKQKIECIQQFAGLCMTTEMKYQKAMFLSGSGANGKGVFLETIRSILAPSSVNISLQDLKDPTITINMIGKTFAFDGDMTKNGGIDDGIFKKTVAGEEIRMKTLYKNPISSKPQCKIMVAGNSLPRVQDTSKGYFRRWIIIKFGECFIGREDRNITKKLLNERDGIFNWMVEGLKSLDKQGYITEPISSDAEISEYNNMASSIHSFFSENVDITGDPSTSVGGKELYKAYLSHCIESNLRPISKQSFFKEFEEKFDAVVQFDRNKCKVFIGIKLKSDNLPF